MLCTDVGSNDDIYIHSMTAITTDDSCSIFGILRIHFTTSIFINKFIL